MTKAEQLAMEVLQLPPDERVAVIDLIELSLRRDDQIERDWSAELDRRAERYDRGESKALPLEEALEEMRRRLAQHRLAGNGS
jgi:putative addiction module component (TIGR02574 family)